MVFWLLFSNESIQNILILSATVAPFASAGIRPVVNRLNQDTTVYYGLVFCVFSWPYMVKWQSSGIIMNYYYMFCKIYTYLKHLGIKSYIKHYINQCWYLYTSTSLEIEAGWVQISSIRIRPYPENWKNTFYYIFVNTHI